MAQIIFKYEIGELIVSDKRTLQVLEREVRPSKPNKSRQLNSKWYRTKCSRCGWEDNWVVQGELPKTPCSCCRGFVVVKGINDVATTHPHLVDYFQGGVEEASLYKKGDKISITPVCPHCNTVKQEPIWVKNLIKQNGFSCFCSNKRSIGERIVSALLKHYDVEFESEKIFNWAKHKKYDFFLPKYNTIIEVHGSQHYKREHRHPTWRSYQEEHENDLVKFDLSVINGIEQYIVLDCCKSEYSYIQDSIFNSGLLELIGKTMSESDWCVITKSSTKSVIKEVCFEFENTDKTIEEISKDFNMARITIRNYLKCGAELGYCSYKPNHRKDKSKRGVKVDVYKDGIKLNKMPYSSSRELSRRSSEDFGVYLHYSSIQKVCRGLLPTYKGYSFKIATERGDANE